MAHKTSPRTGKKRTKQQQAMYRRRRIVFGIATVLVLSFIVFCLYSLTQGVVAVNREIHHADVYAISRKEVPSPTQQQKSSVPDCDASNVALSLTPAASSFGVGGTMDFTASVKYNGSGKAGCLIDVSQAGMVLTIKSGKDVVWKSNVCPVDTDYRLIAKGDEVKQTITWPGVRSGSECADAADLRTWTVACIRPNCRSKDMRKPSRNRSASQWNKIYRLCYSYDFAYMRVI